LTTVFFIFLHGNFLMTFRQTGGDALKPSITGFFATFAVFRPVFRRLKLPAAAF
jgi:hypothetical protein